MRSMSAGAVMLVSCVRLCVLALTMTWPLLTSGQSLTQVATASTFAPGGQELFALDLSAARAGTIPRGVERLSGALDVVTRDGVPMLRATEKSEFLIRLSSTLPEKFTIEVDIVPKLCCPPPDLSLEGTPTINQGTGSAHLLWTGDADHGWVGVIGGAADNREFPIPDDVRATLPGLLSRVGVSFEGRTIRFYTNGTLLYEVQAQFARGSVLRVTLGGESDGEGSKPVFLARLRVATGAPATVVTTIAPATGTITPLTTTQATQPPPASSGALATGPVGSGNPAAATSADALAAPAPRVLSLAGISGAGMLVTTHSIAMPEIAAVGSVSVATQRTLRLTGITAFGSRETATSRTIALTGVTAVGSASVARSTDPAPRSAKLTEATASGAVPTPLPRTIALTALAGAGQSSVPAPQRITLAAITATGGVGLVPPRTIRLAGLTASGAKTP